MHREHLRDWIAVLSLACCVTAAVPGSPAAAAEIYSKRALFDERKAVTVMAHGRYELQLRQFGPWTTTVKGSLELAGRTYSWKVDEGEGSFVFTLHELESNLLLAVHPSDDPDVGAYRYGLYERSKDGFLFYTVKCEDLLNMRIPDVLRPQYVDGKCLYSDQKILEHALVVYGSLTRATARLMPLKP